MAGDKTTAGSRSIEHAGVVRTFEHSTVFAPGHIVATRYRVIRFIARGGMGEVYEVEDLELHLSVAMKTISSERVNDRRQIERMKREILLARRITHPNICRVFDVGYHVEDDVEIVFLTMELIVGESLDRRIARLGPFSVEDARPLVRQMADALAAAHAAGVIHRDFKSQNILLVEDRSASGNPLRVIVTDFGLARSCEGDASVTTDFAGTPAYMAPEQITGDAIEPAVDLYALGVTTFEMVTGQLPFDGPSPLAITVKKCQEPAPEARTLRTDLDARWSAAIARALERDPRRRFASPHELVAALEPGRPMPRRTARAMTVAGAAAVVLGGSAAFWLATQRSASYGPVRTRSGRLAFSVGGPGVEAIEGLAFDAERNLYIAGHTTAAFEFRGHHIPSFNRSSKTSFVIAMTPDGDVRWTRAFGGSGDTRVNSLAVGPDGEIAISGWITGAAELDGRVIKPARHNDGFAMVLERSGKTRWIWQMGSSGRGQLRHVAFAPDGSIIVAGDYAGVVDLGGARLDSGSTDDRAPFLARLDAHGQLSWVRAASGSNDGRFWQVAIADGAVFAVGFVDRTTTFDAKHHIVAGKPIQAIAARFELSTGNLVWLRDFGTDQRGEELVAIAVKNKRLVAGGAYSGTPTLGAFTLPAGDRGDAMVAELAIDTGDVIWARGLAGSQYQQIRQVEISDAGEVVAIGRFAGELPFAPGDAVPSVKAVESEDGFIIDFERSGRIRRARTFGTALPEKPRVMTRDPDGVLTLAGTFRDALTVEERVLDGDGMMQAFVFQVSP